MDEAFVVFFTHKYLDQTRGKNNAMMKYPEGSGMASQHQSRELSVLVVLQHHRPQ